MPSPSRSSQKIIADKSDGVSWGIGIESEAMLLTKQLYPTVVSPRLPGTYPVQEPVILSDDLQKRLTLLLQSARFPMNIDLDIVGAERPVIELITRQYKNRTLWAHVAELIETRARFLADFNLFVMPYKPGNSGIATWPEHGANYLIQSRKRKSTQVDIPRYLGSYHLNFTLPHPASCKPSQFLHMHVKAASALQWIEPLLLSALGCPNPASIIDGHRFTEMSVRHSEEPLATALAADLTKGFPDRRKQDEGYDEYRIFSKKIKQLTFPEDREKALINAPGKFDPTNSKERTLALQSLARNMKKRSDSYPRWLKLIFQNAMSSPLALRHFIRLKYGSTLKGINEMPIIGSDFRRDAQKGEQFGFEFRLLDYFPPDSLLDILRLLFYVMDSTNDWGRKSDLFNIRQSSRDLSVHKQYLAIILEGWDSPLLPPYLSRLNKVFGLSLPQSPTVFDCLQNLSNALFTKYGQGRGVYSRHVDKDADGRLFQHPPQVPNINKNSWEYFFKNSYPQLAKHIQASKLPVTPKFIREFLHRTQPNSPISFSDIAEDLSELLAFQYQNQKQE